MASRSILYFADLTGCEALLAFSPDGIAEAFVSAIERAGGTIVKRASHHFPGGGLTCVLVLKESHAVLHTWPEFGTINIDIFSCTPRLRGLEVIDELTRLFGAQHVSTQQHRRADSARIDPDDADA